MVASEPRHDRGCPSDGLPRRTPCDTANTPETRDVRFQELADGLCLMTCTVVRGRRKVTRSTAWRQVGPDWSVIFDRETVVDDS